MIKKQHKISETKANNVSSKLRRLKIEENILIKAIKKLDHQNNYEMSDQDLTCNMELKNLAKSCMDSYTKIKTLFDDIKIITNSQELLADIEIDEIKKKVLELETIMQSFKSQLQTDLSSLKTAETVLVKELEEIHLASTITKKHPKTSSASLKQAIPSPVRLMMTSPLKCPEVQEFQDFMKNSPNRYGGWNEYHHNIFATLWKKYFGNSLQTNCVESDFASELVFDNFKDECLLKLQGIDNNKLLSHIDWYKKYLILKSKQQDALDKWKSNRLSMKKVPENQTHNSARSEQQASGSARKKLCEITKSKLQDVKITPKCISSDDIERLMKPTKQWLSRCYEDGQNIEQFYDIENFEKLGVPNWRQHIS